MTIILKQITGEPDALKGASPVRRGVDAKVSARKLITRRLPTPTQRRSRPAVGTRLPQAVHAQIKSWWTACPHRAAAPDRPECGVFGPPLRAGAGLGLPDRGVPSFQAGRRFGRQEEVEWA